MNTKPDNEQGQVLTFYSYKGGVGRSFALANCATLLACWGFQVICLDWDLEAPGLSYYFKVDQQRPGILDWINDPNLDWKDCVQSVETQSAQGRLSLITAGRHDDAGQHDRYFASLQDLDWQSAYAEHELGQRIEGLRKNLKRNYDFVLVDSRTGITDIGGICGIQLPDVVIALTTANAQSINGTLDVGRRLEEGRSKLVYDRPALKIVPVLSRFDSREEYSLSEGWRFRVARELEPLFSSWLPRQLKPLSMVNFLAIPYVSRWSFGEFLAVLQETEPSPEHVSYSLHNIAALIANHLGDIVSAVQSRDDYLRRAINAGSRAMAGAKRGEFPFDVFISYKMSEELKQALEAEGLSVLAESDSPSLSEKPLNVLQRQMAAARFIVMDVGGEEGTVQNHRIELASKLVFSNSGQVLLPIITSKADIKSLPGYLQSLHILRIEDAEDHQMIARHISNLVNPTHPLNPPAH